jgi:ATP-dependent DNA ligase
MEAKLAEALPEGPGWQFEPKWDGFRALAFRQGGAVDLRAKSGKPLGRYFPEVVAMLSELSAETFVLDGELVIARGGSLSFEALQMRLHPAESRIRRLAAETPARLILFDCLTTPRAAKLMEAPLVERRAALEAFHEAAADAAPALRLSPYTRDRRTAQVWLDHTGGALDGVIAKRLDEPYRPGERAMIKVKRLRTVDCVVGGFRYEHDSALVGSLLLGLYDADGLLHHVGFTATLSDAERPALTARLEALKGAAGFTGDAPGGPSRWTTERSAEWVPLRPELVVEVRYDHVSGRRFRHGTRLLRWRPDKAASQCTFDQLDPPLAPSALVSEVLAG